MIKVSIHGLGSGQCALTGKTESDGITIGFDPEAPVFLSKKAFWQLLSMRVNQAKQAEQKPAAKPAAPLATPVNGPAMAVK